MGPRIRKTSAKPPQRRPERFHPRINEELYSRLQRLSAVLENLQSCSCPPDCSGPDAVRTPPASARPSEDPQTPRRPARCREVSKRSDARNRAQILAEGQGTMEIELPRLGDTASGNLLRMSVIVHTDPDSKLRRGVSNIYKFVALFSMLARTAFSSPAQGSDAWPPGDHTSHCSHS